MKKARNLFYLWILFCGYLIGENAKILSNNEGDWRNIGAFILASLAYGFITGVLNYNDL